MRLLHGVSGKTFPFHLFPCTVQDLWSCLKAYFLYCFVWLDNRLWTSLSALQQIRVQKSLFFFLIGRLAYCQICLSVSRLCNAEARIKWQESSCYFTNATFQLSARSDTLKHAQPMLWGFVLALVFAPLLLEQAEGVLMVGTWGFFFQRRDILVEGMFSALCLMMDGTLTYIAVFLCCQTCNYPKEKKKKRKNWKVGHMPLKELHMKGGWNELLREVSLGVKSIRPTLFPRLYSRFCHWDTLQEWDLECQLSWSSSLAWPRMPVLWQSQIAQGCKGMELKSITRGFIFIYFLVTLKKKFCHTFPFRLTRQLPPSSFVCQFFLQDLSKRN